MSTVPFRIPEVHYDYYVIVPHPSELKLLMIRGINGWTLPHFVPNEHHTGVVRHINDTVYTKFGIRVSTRRCVDIHFNAETKRGSRAYILDNLDPVWEPNRNSKWVSFDELESLNLALPEHRKVIQDWFVWEIEDPELRVPWSRRGWFAQATQWIYEELIRRKMEPIGEIVQTRAWVRSCVARVETTEGWVYFKAVPKMFAYEPVVTRILSQRYPKHAPKVIAADAKHAWMLMQGFGGSPMMDDQDVRRWAQVLKVFATIQIDLAQRTQQLITLGFPDRHLDQLVAQIDRFMVDIAHYLHPDEATRLRNHATTIRQMCWELLQVDVPLSLGHGDFWSGNITLTDKGSIFHDWSDSSVTHPFFDIADFLASPDGLPNIPYVENRLRDAYLLPWKTYAPMEQLQHAYELAKPLSFYHQVLVYQTVVLPNVEQRARWEVEKMIPFLLRQLLDRLETEPEQKLA